MTPKEFITKWGACWPLAIEAFIAEAPSFPGDKELAAKIGEIVTDIDSILDETCPPKPMVNYKGPPLFKRPPKIKAK